MHRSLLLLFLPVYVPAQPYMATGFKIGEVTHHSAIVWVRTTAVEQASPLEWGSAPGMEARVSISAEALGSDTLYLSRTRLTSADSDYSTQLELHGLEPDMEYKLRVVASNIDDGSGIYVLTGAFRTAPTPDQDVGVDFTVVTCQDLPTIDAGANGFKAYKAMHNLAPDFFVHTGDIVYYDHRPEIDPIDVEKARQMWHEAWLFGYSKDFLQNVSSYWMKDDHDTLVNDCWPGQTFGNLTFSEGLELFREQVPMGRHTYRTVRWGKRLQVWFLEGRDYRSPNTMPDGPDKTILGYTQKQWLEETLRASHATFKIVISPTPVVGPDKPGKNDSHANEGFSHEGDWLRGLLSGIPNTYVLCGDRHWQYASTHPETGLREFGCGPLSEEHISKGGHPGESPDLHDYFEPDGGFLHVQVLPDGPSAELVVQWYDTQGEKPTINHTIRIPAED